MQSKRNELIAQATTEIQLLQGVPTNIKIELHKDLECVDVGFTVKGCEHLFVSVSWETWKKGEWFFRHNSGSFSPTRQHENVMYISLIKAILDNWSMVTTIISRLIVDIKDVS